MSIVITAKLWSAMPAWLGLRVSHVRAAADERDSCEGGEPAGDSGNQHGDVKRPGEGIAR